MGGLLCADTVRDIAASTREGDPIWPPVVGIIGESTSTILYLRIKCADERGGYY